jgi:hypothetical protein
MQVIDHVRFENLRRAIMSISASDVILISKGTPRAFCAAGRSTGWVRPPVVNIMG